MLSSRRGLLAWIAIGALLLPAGYGALSGTPLAPGRSAHSSGPAVPSLPTVSALTKAPTLLPRTGSIGGPRASPQSIVGEAGAPVISAPPAPAPSTVETVAEWDALHYGTNGGISNGWVPPDVIVSAGPTYVVEMVNLLMGVYTKSGTQVQLTGLALFFNSGADFISDPKVQYDSGSGRWFATVTDVTTSSVLLAVSGSSDPTGPWHHFTIAGSACLDQPILGLGTTTVIVSTNDFSSCTSSPFTYVGAQYWVLNKADLVAGSASPGEFVSTPDPNEFSIHPAQMEGAGAQHYMVSTYWPGAQTTSNALHLFTVSGTPPAAVTVSVTSLPMPTAAVPLPAPQLGSKNTIDTADIRVSDAVWSGGTLWVGFDEACLSTSSRACIRLVQIDTAAGTLLQDFDIDVAGRAVFYPGLRVDGAGSLVVVFGYSSATDYPGVMMSGRLPGDAPNTLALQQIVVAGTGPESPATCKGTCRYGDYFGATADPSNATLVWVAGQMGTSAGWSTHIAALSLKATLGMGWIVVGGGSGYTPPVISYVYGGVSAQQVLGSSTTIVADAGSRWSISLQLPGSSPSSGEIWALNTSAGPGAGSGWMNASNSPPLAFVYYHQYAASLRFNAVGGAGYTSPPQITGVVFGISRSFDLPSQVFLDATSVYSYPALLAGSTASERWLTPGPLGGTASGPLTIDPSYYHQVVVTFAFVLHGATAPSSPQVRYSSLGGGATVTANATVWADSQAAYTYDSALAGASATIRYGPDANGNGTVGVAGTILVTYQRQFLVTVSTDPSNLAFAVTGAGWYDAGATVALSAAAPAGWRFNRWSGDGSGISTTLTVAVQAPLNITALFDAGLTITAGDGGSVSYAYGSTSGTVPSGTSVTIYVPVGTTVTLVATPGSASQTFGGWSGASSGTAAATSVQVNAPGTVAASFGLNVLVVAGLSVVVLVVILGLVLAVLVRRRRKRPPV